MIYFLSLGSNLGEREQTLYRAMQMIEQQIGPVLRCSSFYYSEPWGFDSPNPFCNLCCAVETALSPLEMLHTTQAIERVLGRKEKSDGHYSDRPIDIDLIRAVDGQGLEIACRIENPASPTGTSVLTLPHPLWQQRDFVKVPLAEIMQ
jgi:2-amino-4-hydroxy-6-hydroxymethyldihydropteridine diphosphokinase